MLYFATYFDNNYLSRGIVMYDSLKENCDDFELYVLCLDQQTENYFKINHKKYSNVITVLLSTLESQDSELINCKSNRNPIEYYFTLSPILPMYLFQKFNLPHICTLDADILFFSNPKQLFDLLTKYSIIITPHKFSPEIKQYSKFGKYNVSFQIFKNDNIGNECLQKWRNQCIEWCDDTYDDINERFADQKYLDTWTTDYPGYVKELYDNVSGLAPWNLNNFNIKEKNNQYYSNGEPVIFFHFHHFKILANRLASNGFYYYKAKINKQISKVYLDYWNKLDEVNRILDKNIDVVKRTHLSNDTSLSKKLNDEGAVFFKLCRFKLVYINFQNLFGRVTKQIIKNYA